MGVIKITGKADAGNNHADQHPESAAEAILPLQFGPFSGRFKEKMRLQIKK